MDSFGVAEDTLRLPTPHAWSVHKRTLRGGPRDGVDLVHVSSGALSYAVLPTRGMGLWRGDFRGLPLGWQSPVVGPVHQSTSAVMRAPSVQSGSSPASFTTTQRLAAPSDSTGNATR